MLPVTIKFRAVAMFFFNTDLKRFTKFVLMFAVSHSTAIAIFNKLEQTFWKAYYLPHNFSGP
jgi:hypothetical protein